MYGSSSSDTISIEGACTSGVVPNTKCVMEVALTAARITGVKPTSVYSIITTSMAKMTPAMGVLNEAAIAAAVPQATRMRMLLFGRCNHWPNRLALAAPTWMAGPSRPTECPVTMATVAPANCMTAFRQGSRPA